MDWKRFRKKPVVVEAYQTERDIRILTLSGPVMASAGDWIVKDVKGELYPCKPDIFEKTYDQVDETGIAMTHIQSDPDGMIVFADDPRTKVTLGG